MENLPSPKKDAADIAKLTTGIAAAIAKMSFPDGKMFFAVS